METTHVSKTSTLYIHTLGNYPKEDNIRSYNNLHQEIKHCPNSIFIPPVIEQEVSLVKNVKGKPTAGYDDIPESLVKQCI
jgi:hypothetical protein